MTRVDLARLGDIVGLRGLIGGPFGSKLVSRDYVPQGVPVIRGQNLAFGRFVGFGDCVYVSDEKVARDLSTNLAVPGDLVFTQRGTLGQVAIMPRNGPARAVISQSQMRLRVDPDRALPEYVYYACVAEDFLNQLEVNAIVTGVPHINLGILREMTIPLPSLGEQRRIAEALGALDNLIEADSRSLGAIEKFLQAHFDALSFDSPGGVSLKDRVELNPSYPRPAGVAPYVDMAALPTDSIFIDEVSRRPAAGGARFMLNDVLLARITPCLENGKAAFAGDLLPDQVYVGSTEFIVMRSRQGVPSAWPYFLARSERFREYAIRHMTGSSGRQRLAPTALEHYEVGGDVEALRKFDRLASNLLAAAIELNQECETLRRTRDELLPLLMSGKVRVRPERVAA